MLTIAILFAATIIAPLLSLLPRVRRQDHAENGIMFVAAPAGDMPAEAHEMVEWWCGWLAGFLAALLVALSLTHYLQASLMAIDTDFMIVNAAALVAAFLGNAIARRATLHFDYVGHNVSATMRGDREAEIDRMIHRGDQRGMTRGEVDRLLRKWEWLARFAMTAFSLRYRRGK